MNFDWSAVADALPSLLQGARLTLLIAAIGLGGGVLLGFAVGIGRAYGGRLLRAVALCYVDLIRGTPMVVQAMFLYFAMPIILHTRIEALHAAIITIALNSGAYLSEVVRSAFLSIQPGLRNAGLALGMPFHRVVIHIIGPLAFRRLIAPLGNQCMTSLKDTSIFIVIGVGVGELTRQGQEVIAGNFRSVEVWASVAVFYLIMTGCIALALRVIERRMKIL